MLVSSFFDSPFLRVFFVPDDGSNPSGATDTEEPEKTYTKAEYEAQLARNRQDEARRNKKALEERDSKISGLESKLSDLIAKLEEVGVTPTTPPNSDDLKGKLEGKVVQLEKTLKETSENLRVEQEARIRAERTARDRERDSLLRSALADSDCVEITAGYRYFLPDVVEEEGDDKETVWRLRTPNGNLIEVAEGVKNFLPAFLKKGANTGGSGVTGGSPQHKAQVALENKKTELQTAEAKAKRTKSQSDIARMQQLKREVRKLEAEAQSKK